MFKKIGLIFRRRHDLIIFFCECGGINLQSQSQSQSVTDVKNVRKWTSLTLPIFITPIMCQCALCPLFASLVQARDGRSRGVWRASASRK
jgi:hypothetical protein